MHTKHLQMHVYAMTRLPIADLLCTAVFGVDNHVVVPDLREHQTGGLI